MRIAIVSLILLAGCESQADNAAEVADVKQAATAEHAQAASRNAALTAELARVKAANVKLLAEAADLRKQLASQREANASIFEAATDHTTVRRQPDSIPGNAVPRAQFSESIVGKSPENIIALYGKPDSSSENGGNTTWYYRRRSYDPVTGKPDYQAQIIFFRNDAGEVVVQRVNY